MSSIHRTFDSKWAAASEGAANQSRSIDLVTWSDSEIEDAATAPGAGEATRLAAITEARSRQLSFIKQQDAQACDDLWNRQFYIETYGEQPR